MANLQTSTIAIAKIKVRWEEPYVSEAVNRQLTALPTGIYRGGILVPAAVPDQTIKIVPDDGGGLSNDTFFTIKDSVNDFGLAVRDPDEVILDLSAQWPIVVPVTWWVWAKITYAVSTPTEAKYYVSDTQPTGDYVLFGKLIMSAGNTTIQNSNIMELRTKPVPTKREAGAYVAGDEMYGLLDGADAWNIPTLSQKKAADNAATAPSASNPFVTEADTMDRVFGEPVYIPEIGLLGVNKFQLTGQFYVGKVSQLDATNYFSLRLHNIGVGDKSFPLVENWTTGALVYIDKIHNSGDVLLDPSTDPGVDANGFCTNPFIYMRTSTGSVLYTGDLSVYCFRKKKFSTLEQAPVQALPDGGIDHQVHAERVFDEAHSGSPDNMLSSNVASQINKLLGFINNRIKTVHPESAPANWVLLWRSNNVTLDADVDYKTISIYWYDGQYMMIVNGYIHSLSEIKSGKIASQPISMWWVNGRGSHELIQAGKSSIAAGTTFTFATRANWDSWYNYPFHANFAGNAVAALASLGVSGGTEYPLNFYVGMPNGEKGFMLTYNAEWTGSAWEGYSGAAQAFALLVSENGMKFFYKADTTSSWDTTTSATGWTSEMHWSQSGGRMEAYQEANGLVCDEVRFCFYGKNWSAGDSVVHDRAAPTWHAKIVDIDIDIIPPNCDVTLNLVVVGSHANWVGGVSSITLEQVDGFGCRIHGQSDTLGAGGSAWYHGKAVVVTD